MTDGIGMTSASIRSRTRASASSGVIRHFGFDAPESTIRGQLHGLFKIDVVTDADTPDRPCRVSGNPKKTWRLLTDAEREQLVAQRQDDAEESGEAA